MAKIVAGVMLGMFACGAVAAAERPQLSVSPKSGLVDAPFRIVVENILPGARVTVSAARPDAHARTWTAVESI